MDTVNQDIWAKLEFIRKQQPENNLPKKPKEESTLIFLGDANSGKSIIIQNYLKSTAASKDPKPTIALEYNFAKQKFDDDFSSSCHSNIAVAHIWELGGGLPEHSLLKVPVNKQTLSTSAYVICCDLSSPNNVISSLQKWLQVVRDLIDGVAAENKIELTTLSQSNIATTLYANHKHDATRCRPCKAPLCILLTKYDLFKSRTVTERRALNQSIRLLAHYHGASIITTSTNDPVSMDNLRATLNSLCFPRHGEQRGLHASSRVDQGVDRPLLLVAAGSDNFESILLSSTTNRSQEHQNSWKTCLVSSEAEAASFLTPHGIAKDMWTRVKDHVSNIIITGVFELVMQPILKY